MVARFGGHRRDVKPGLARVAGAALASAGFIVACASGESAVGPTSITDTTATTSTTATAIRPPEAPTVSTGGAAPATPGSRCPAVPLASSPAPTAVRDALAARLNDPRFAGLDVSASVWIDGWGEVAVRNPDLGLLPASNEKIVTAMGAFELLDLQARLSTTVVATGPIVDGTLHGDLVLVGGGDPTLTREGPHSLAMLAARVRAAGITRIAGSVAVDESRYDTRRDAPGWLAWHRPGYVGSLSALLVDRNQYRGDGAFLADPALANGELFRGELSSAGVLTTSTIRHEDRPNESQAVADLQSPTIGELVATMLTRSDNLIAEVLVKEIGHTAVGDGSTTAGLDAIVETLAQRCVTVGGHSADGSGLSREDRRSAREWRVLLQEASQRPWWSTFRAALPSGGLTGSTRAGDLHAKGGSIVVGRSLSGYLTTTGGRAATFSVIANGPTPSHAEAPVDGLVAAIARTPG